jgi:hypothetical protein
VIRGRSVITTKSDTPLLFITSGDKSLSLLASHLTEYAMVSHREVGVIMICIGVMLIGCAFAYMTQLPEWARYRSVLTADPDVPMLHVALLKAPHDSVC